MESRSSLQIPLGNSVFVAPDFSPASSYWLEHIPFAFWLVEHAKPATLVELGVHTGGSFCNFCEAVKLTRIDCRCYGIDNFEGDPHYQNYGPEVLETLRAYHDPRYKEFSSLIKSDFVPALEHFADGSIDILHIDGTHFYDDVRRDYETWKSKLSNKAIVLFHDTNVRERDFGVHRLWSELVAVHPGFEFHHCNGLGVLVPGEMPSDAIHALVDADSGQAADIRRFFAALGDRVTRKALVERDVAVITKLRADDVILRESIALKERIAAEEAAAHYQLEQVVAGLHSELDSMRRELYAKESAREAARQEKVEFLEKEITEARIRDQVSRERLEALKQEHQKKLDDLKHAKSAAKDALRLAAEDEAAALAQLHDTRSHLKLHWADTISRQHRIRRMTAQAHLQLALQREQILQLVDTTPPAPPTPAPTKKGQKPELVEPTPPDELDCSGLFDEEFYRSQFPEQIEIHDALQHYRKIGWLLGYRPNRMFDPLDYARRHSLQGDVEPLMDYVTRGIREGLRPHPLFDPDFYIAAYGDIAAYPLSAFHHFIHWGIREKRRPNPLFDPVYYASCNLDVPIEDSVDHYFRFGCWEGRNPHPLFDSAFYLREHPFAAEEMENPLLHYLQHGYRPEFAPHPLFDPGYYVTANGIDMSACGNLLVHYLEHGLADRSLPHPLFDAERYLDLRPDVRDAGIHPLVHYCTDGATDLTSPHLLFDAVYYISRNPEIASRNPLIHYLAAEGRNCPDPHPLFDGNFYLRTNPDVRKSGVNPLLHFIKAAPAERRQPHPLFDSGFYMDTYRDVRELGMNALTHYLLIGAAEGRMPNPYFETRAYREVAMQGAPAGMNPLVHFASREVGTLKSPSRHFDVEWYLATYPDIKDAGINPLVHFLTIGEEEGRQPCGTSMIRANLEAKYPDITRPSGIGNWTFLMHRLRQPLVRRVTSDGRRRLNMLFPDLDAQIVFGGYISAFEFVAAFAPTYHIRLISTMQKVDATNLHDLRAKFSSNPRIFPMLESAELVDLSAADATLDVHKLDVFAAYSVWDAFLCNRLATSLGQKEFIYFCQEDEAIFHCNDSLHALARQGQKLPAVQVYNTEILRNHFRINRLGVFSRGEIEGLASSLSFQHALVDTRPPTVAEMRNREKVQVLLYARPEDHAKRNLFEITLMGIRLFLEANPDVADHVEFTGVGSMHFDGEVMLTDEIPLRIKPKLSYSDYAKSLAGYDIGISLMYAPHPSILPFEMASAGLVVVTNHYEERDVATLESISSNIIPVEPSPEGIMDGFARALQRVGEYQKRIDGARFDWSRSWERSFDDGFRAVMDARITRILETTAPTEDEEQSTTHFVQSEP